MSLRWRQNGALLCAAKHPPCEYDTYIDDCLHYRLAVELRIIIPEDDEHETGRWKWRRDADASKV